MALADAQALSIRKLLSKASYDSVVTHSPPLPKARSLIAKLHLECVALYSSAKSLAKSVSAGGAQSISSRFGTGTGTNEVSMELRRYLTDETTLHNALAKKWMGVDAGEVGGKKGGEAVGWLVWAKSEMESLKDGGATGPGGGSVREKDLRELRKVKVKRELEDIGAFLKNYKKMNDTVGVQSSRFACIPRTYLDDCSRCLSNLCQIRPIYKLGSQLERSQSPQSPTHHQRQPLALVRSRTPRPAWMT